MKKAEVKSEKAGVEVETEWVDELNEETALIDRGQTGERKEVKGVRWLLSFVVGQNLASSPNLLLFLTCMAGKVNPSL